MGTKCEQGHRTEPLSKEYIRPGWDRVLSMADEGDRVIRKYKNSRTPQLEIYEVFTVYLR